MRLIRFAVLALIVQLVGHEMVYAVSGLVLDVSDSLRETAHGLHWSLLLLTGATAGAVTLIAVAVRWRRLRPGRGTARRALSAAHPTSHAGHLLRLWGPLFVASLTAFVVQENLEHAGFHGAHAPGLGLLLEAEFVAATPVFAAVSLLVAVAAGFVHLRLAALEAGGPVVDRDGVELTGESASPLTGEAAPLPGASRWSGTPDLGRAPPRPLVA